MKVNYQINTDRCTKEDSAIINAAVADAIDEAMGKVWKDMGIPSRRVVSIRDDMTIYFNMGPANENNT